MAAEPGKRVWLCVPRVPGFPPWPLSQHAQKRQRSSKHCTRRPCRKALCHIPKAAHPLASPTPAPCALAVPSEGEATSGAHCGCAAACWAPHAPSAAAVPAVRLGVESRGPAGASCRRGVETAPEGCRVGAAERGASAAGRNAGWRLVPGRRGGGGVPAAVIEATRTCSLAQGQLL